MSFVIFIMQVFYMVCLFFPSTLWSLIFPLPIPVYSISPGFHFYSKEHVLMERVP